MILITGAGGHIGNVLVKHLYKKGHKDLRLFVQEGEDTSHIGKYAAEIVRGDIRDKFAVSAAVRGCDDVFHLAGLVKISGVHKKLVYDINVGGTKNVVQACLEKKVKRLLHVSSVHALREPADGSIDETLVSDLGDLAGDYAKSKAMATTEVMNAIQKGLNAVIVFPSGVIGAVRFPQLVYGQRDQRLYRREEDAVITSTASMTSWTCATWPTAFSGHGSTARKARATLYPAASPVWSRLSRRSSKTPVTRFGAEKCPRCSSRWPQRWRPLITRWPAKNRCCPSIRWAC